MSSEMTNFHLTASSADGGTLRGLLCGGFFDSMKLTAPAGISVGRCQLLGDRDGVPGEKAGHPVSMKRGCATGYRQERYPVTF